MDSTYDQNQQQQHPLFSSVYEAQKIVESMNDGLFHEKFPQLCEWLIATAPSRRDPKEYALLIQMLHPNGLFLQRVISSSNLLFEVNSANVSEKYTLFEYFWHTLLETISKGSQKRLVRDLLPVYLEYFIPRQKNETILHILPEDMCMKFSLCVAQRALHSLVQFDTNSQKLQGDCARIFVRYILCLEVCTNPDASRSDSVDSDYEVQTYLATFRTNFYREFQSKLFWFLQNHFTLSKRIDSHEDAVRIWLTWISPWNIDQKNWMKDLDVARDNSNVVMLWTEFVIGNFAFYTVLFESFCSRSLNIDIVTTSLLANVGNATSIGQSLRNLDIFLLVFENYCHTVYLHDCILAAESRLFNPFYDGGHVAPSVHSTPSRRASFLKSNPASMVPYFAELAFQAKHSIKLIDPTDSLDYTGVFCHQSDAIRALYTKLCDTSRTTASFITPNANEDVAEAGNDFKITRSASLEIPYPDDESSSMAYIKWLAHYAIRKIQMLMVEFYSYVKCMWKSNMFFGNSSTASIHDQTQLRGFLAKVNHLSEMMELLWRDIKTTPPLGHVGIHGEEDVSIYSQFSDSQSSSTTKRIRMSSVDEVLKRTAFSANGRRDPVKSYEVESLVELFEWLGSFVDTGYSHLSNKVSILPNISFASGFRVFAAWNNLLWLGLCILLWIILKK